MKIIGLSGGVAAGKNFIAEIFAKFGCAIFDADLQVHNLIASDLEVIEKIKKNFPESFIEGKIERKILGKIVFADKKKLKILEEIIHPKVQKKYQEFFVKCQRKKIEFLLLNIPLLQESSYYKCDFTIAIIASKDARLKRFITREKQKNPQSLIKDLKLKFSQITENQISDSVRKKQADFVIKNDDSALRVERQVAEILKEIKQEN
jgi:dephospho-CoA kinase